MRRRLLVLELEAMPSSTFTYVRVIVGGRTAAKINAGWGVPAEQAIIDAEEILARTFGNMLIEHAPSDVVFTAEEEV